MADKLDKKVRVWDVPVRLFHWTLVILLVTSYFSGRAGGDWMKLHFWSGYTILTLLLFRIAWGFVGSTTARFSHFVKGPARVVRLPPRSPDQSAHLRRRAQSRRRHHGAGADLRRAGAGGGRPVLRRHRHGHGQRPARQLNRRQMGRPPDELSTPSG